MKMLMQKSKTLDPGLRQNPASFVHSRYSDQLTTWDNSPFLYFSAIFSSDKGLIFPA
jgi:hypothetical protein